MREITINHCCGHEQTYTLEDNEVCNESVLTSMPCAKCVAELT